MASGTAFAQNLKTVTYQDGSQKLNGLVTSNAGKKLPGVLILPAWKGIDDEAKTAAADLEKQGYIAFMLIFMEKGISRKTVILQQKRQVITRKIMKLTRKEFRWLWNS